MTIKHIACLALLFATVAQAQPRSHTKNIEPLSIGEKIEIYSDIMSESRILNIYLPYNYSADSAKEYPVIYLLDGSIHEDFIHIAGIVQFGSYSWINFIPESIVVGISNIDRKRDFTFPTKRKQYQKAIPNGGGSDAFIRFIENDLIPLVSEKYNTSSTKTIIGQSLGGLLASEILIKKPYLFDNYIIISPSLWWDKKSLLDVPIQEFKSPKSIYIGVGKEGKVMEETAKTLHDNIAKKMNPSTQLYFEFFEKQNHANILHLAVYNAFNIMFKPAQKKQ